MRMQHSKVRIREAMELRLTHHELYQQIGIYPSRPRGVLTHGPPGTGKTMLAKAVANYTTASFIIVVGSEFTQKYLGDVLVKVQRILMELFNQTVYVMVVMATTRAVDPTLLRPGRLDRKIEFPLPDKREKKLVFQILLDLVGCSMVLLETGKIMLAKAVANHAWECGPEELEKLMFEIEEGDSNVAACRAGGSRTRLCQRTWLSG
ncbi:UNVERIFIED_CONTAM: 26S proteasome regulatory subunitB [Sesamum latifolium]|uniref:26S proteasome regulatory subunitB n=1 Tax=Sesamum latifolium TaxID=2727402 RepID=A0AAW2X488_9LAMI